MLRGFGKIPCPVLFLDTETTGLTDADRVVSFGAVLLKSAAEGANGSQDLNLSATHFLFNPGRDSHPQARAVHGHSDWELSHQEPFSERAGEILELFRQARLIVGHNIEFDMKFLLREFSHIGIEPKFPQTYCTMRNARASPMFTSAKLSDLAVLVRVPRASDRHGALEDAWIAMHVYFHMEVSAAIKPIPFSIVNEPGFENYREPPTAPIEARKPPRKPRAKRSSEPKSSGAATETLASDNTMSVP